MITLQQFYDMLEQHDWVWYMADDGRSYRAGQQAESSLLGVAKENGIEFQKLFDAYHDYVFSGPSWSNGGPKLPKPKRPE